MKKQIGYLLIATLSFGLFFTSCKKIDKTNDNTEEFKMQSDDQSRFTNETDAVANDANTALENMGGSYGGETPTTPLLPSICDAAIVVDTASTPRKITITYNGLNCSGTRTRTGSVVISFAPSFRWNNPGANYSVTYQNLRITRISDNKSITINGTKTVTNVTGGRLRTLATRGSAIVHELTSSNMSITFDDGSSRTWQVAKRRTFTYSDGIVISVTGIAPTSIGAGVAEWGTNRNGNAFTTTFNSPLVVRQSCGFRLVSGQVTHNVLSASLSVTFGLNAEGNPVNSCVLLLFYKVVWTGASGVSVSFIRPY